MYDRLTADEMRAAYALCAPGVGTMSRIVRFVSFETGFSVAEIRGMSRFRPLSRARQTAMWRASQAGLSLTQIGNFLSRDHTSVLYGIRAVENRMKEQAT